MENNYNENSYNINEEIENQPEENTRDIIYFKVDEETFRTMRFLSRFMGALGIFIGLSAFAGIFTWGFNIVSGIKEIKNLILQDSSEGYLLCVIYICTFAILLLMAMFASLQRNAAKDMIVSLVTTDSSFLQDALVKIAQSYKKIIMVIGLYIGLTILIVIFIMSFGADIMGLIHRI